MKRIVIVCAVAAAVLFGGRLLLSWGTWSSCTRDGGSGFVLAFEHLGAPPSMTDCALLQLAAPPATEPTPASVPPPSLGPGEWVDSGYGKASCAEGGCTVHGPCPLGYPTVSHYDCTTPTIPPEQWPRDP
jgi:hypothetical protein